MPIGAGGLFDGASLPNALGEHQARVPPAFLKLAHSVIWHSNPERFGLLYQALWRLDRNAGEPLSHADPLGRRLQGLAIFRTREEFVPINEAAERHRLLAQGMNDVVVVDDLIVSPVGVPRPRRNVIRCVPPTKTSSRSSNRRTRSLRPIRRDGTV